MLKPLHKRETLKSYTTQIFLHLLFPEEFNTMVSNEQPMDVAELLKHIFLTNKLVLL
jgi:hypothetical protein